jgi:hypothetical protein
MHRLVVEEKRWIFLGAPYIERLLYNRSLNAALRAVTAAAGLLYSLLLHP